MAGLKTEINPSLILDLNIETVGKLENINTKFIKPVYDASGWCWSGGGVDMSLPEWLGVKPSVQQYWGGWPGCQLPA